MWQKDIPRWDNQTANSRHTNEMALWSTVRHKYHWICSHSHSRHTLVTHTSNNGTLSFRVVSGRKEEKRIRHIKKFRFLLLLSVDLLWVPSRWFYCKRIRVRFSLFFISLSGRQCTFLFIITYVLPTCKAYFTEKWRYISNEMSSIAMHVTTTTSEWYTSSST